MRTTLPSLSRSTVAAVLAALLVLPVAPAAAAETVDHSQTSIVGPSEPSAATARTTAASCPAPCFTFNGRGSHHSVGMSQYGAYALADPDVTNGNPRTAAQILTHYYPGTSVRSRELDYDIRVAVVARNASSPQMPEVRVVPRGAAASVIWKGGSKTATVPQDTAWTVAIGSDGRCTTSGPNGPVNLGGCPVFDPGARIEVQTPSSSGWRRHNEYGGTSTLDIFPDRNGSRWRLTAVVDLPLEEYLLGLAEVPYSWPAATLQAQAIAGRSYATHRMINRGATPDPDVSSTNDCGCHVWDSMQDQVYGGADRFTSARWEQWRQAVKDSSGLVVVAPQGSTGYGDTADGVVQAFYSASSHGRTESKHQSPAFGSAYWEYMRTVDDPWSTKAKNNTYWGTWSFTFPASTVADKVGMDRVDNIVVTVRNDSGSARTVEFRGSGTKTYSANTVRQMFGLRSNGFGIGDEVWGGPAQPAAPSDLFTDDDGSAHEADIDWLANEGITVGCNPPKNTLFCPGSSVTRGQMAAFLVRALELPAGNGTFEDTGGTRFEADIAALAKAGITKGCNPPKNTRYCPNDAVTRAEMASFLQRALSLPDGPSGAFRDVPADSTHARAIGALRDAGITLGCNPPTNDRYCPGSSVTRAQMASFLRRGLS